MRKTKPSIYIIERNSSERKALKTLLLKANYQIIGSVAEGSGALQDIISLHPDFLLLDLHPEEENNGLQLVIQLNRLLLNIKVIFLSKYSDLFTLQGIVDAKPKGFLKKPYDKDNLLTMMHLLYKQERILELQKRVESRKNELIVAYGNTKLKLYLDELLYIQSDRNHVYVVSTFISQYIRVNLNWFQTNLPTDNFIQINRSVIVNSAYITSYDKHTVQIGEMKFRVSKNYHPNLLGLW